MSARFLTELKRRNVIRMAGLYAVGSWLIVQVAGTVFPAFDVPGWALRALIIVLVIGFAPALVFAWVFELTPEGLKRDAEVQPGESIAPQTARRLDRAIIAVLICALVYFGIDKFVLAPRRGETAAVSVVREQAGTQTASVSIEEKSIAVLPLANTSGDPDNEYFSDGLSEELISVLGKLPDLKTIGRSSSFHFKNSKDDSRTIGARLGVMHLLEGSVRKQGDRVRIVVGLIKAVDGRELWSETYDRELKDIFAIQSEIATAVVEQLKLKLLGAPQRFLAAPESVNLAAYNALLQGQYFARRFNEADQRRALAYLEEAVRIDPNYGLAHAHLSRVWRALAASFLLAPADIAAAYVHARESAQSALRLAPDLADAHVAVGWVRVTPDIDLPGAEFEFRRAAALAPHDARTLQALGYLLAALGNLDEAEKLNQQAIDTDPFLVGAYLNRARNQMALKQLDASEATLRKILELQSDTSHVYAYLTIVDLQRGDVAAALRDAALEPEGFWRDYAVTLAQQAQGDHATAEAALTAFITQYGHGGPYQVAVVYAFRKEPDLMFKWLDNAFAERDSGLTQIMVTPFLLDYRADPRFAAFARKLKIDSAVLVQHQ
jgi:TolB-like protein/Tfp pilus assembly protein PilF